MLGLVLGGCGKKEAPAGAPSAPEPGAGGEPEVLVPVHFVDVAEQAGLSSFRHGGSSDTGFLESPIPREQLTPEFVRSKISSFLGSGVAFADYDSDGDPDLYFVNCGPDEAGSSNALFENNGDGTFSDVTEAAGVGDTGQGFAVTSGDYDNDGLADFYVANNGPNVLYRNNGDGTFSDVTAEVGAQDDRFTIAATFTDYDHDGDLDLYLINYIDFSKLPGKAELDFPEDFPGAENLLLQNDGSGRFHPRTTETKLSDGARRGRGAVFADFTKNNAVDLFLINDMEPSQLKISSWDGHRWDGTFREEGPSWGADFSGSSLSVTADYLDPDPHPDLYIARGPGEEDLLLLNVNRFIPYTRTPEVLRRTRDRLSTAGVFFDYDNDGDKDILSVGEDVSGSGAPALLLYSNNGDSNIMNLQASFTDVTRQSGLEELGSPRCRGLSVADFDGDGDLDVCIQVNGGSPLLLRNEGGNRNNWLGIRLRGVRDRDNRLGIGSKVQVYWHDERGERTAKNHIIGSAGYQSTSSMELHFGLGSAERASRVVVNWPLGFIQGATEVRANRVLTLEETTAGKFTSCPLVFAWDGETYRFLSDTLGSVLLGAIQPDGSTFSLLDTDEYLKIPGDRLKPRDGHWSIIFSDRLRETAYLDRAKLLVVDHPADVVFYANERLSSRPPYPEFKLFATRSERLPVSATREDGTDILPQLSQVDRVYAPHGKPLQYEGITEKHSYILDLGDLSGYEHPVLVLYGWSDFATVNARYAASQAGISVLPISLEVKKADGTWVTAVEDIGEPGGWPKPQTVDLAGLFKTDDYRIRITSNTALYYDRATVIDVDSDIELRVSEIDPARAELVRAGFATAYRADGRKPDLFDHERMMPFSPWAMACYGRHTRYGDVRELLLRIDDVFAIMSPGDEAVLDFAVSDAPDLPEGWQRDFLFFADGFMKDIRFRVAHAAWVEPLPFHGMTGYPPPPGESYPMTEERRRYLETYNTRDITPENSPLADGSTFSFDAELSRE